MQLVQQEMEPCRPEEGSPATVFLELFEQSTGQPFSQTPGALLTSRIRALAKVLGNISREVVWDPPLLSVVKEAGLLWSRRPRLPTDIAAWRVAVEAAEAHSAPMRKLQDQMRATNQGLAAWFKGHRHLRPTAVENGESGMALLLLWEVVHQQQFPSMGGRGRNQELSYALMGFSKRLEGRQPETCSWHG